MISTTNQTRNGNGNLEKEFIISRPVDIYQQNCKNKFSNILHSYFRL